MSLLPTEGRLTVADKARRKKLETVIQAGLKTFIDVGQALEAVRAEKLYRDKWKTFEAYCEDMFELSRNRAYQLIDAAKTVKRLESMETLPKIFGKNEEVGIDKIIPNEHAANVISKVPDDEIQEVLDVVAEDYQATGKPVTGKSIKDAAAKVAEKKQDKPEPTIKEQVSSLRSVALQHYRAAMRAVDDLHRLKPDKDTVQIIAAANVTIQDAVERGFK